MCDFFSAVATKDKLHAFYWVDSHEDIIELAGLSNQDRDPVDVHFVRLELRPDNPMTLNFEKWAFGVDQDRVPDWFVPEEWHQKMIEYLRTVPSLVEGEVKTLAEECWFCAIPVERMIGRSAIRFLLAGGTVNKVWDGGTVNEVRAGGTVNEVWDGGTVNEVRAGGTVNKVWDGGTVNEVWDGGTVNKVWDGGTVNEVRDGGTVNKVLAGGTVNKVWAGGRILDDKRVKP